MKKRNTLHKGVMAIFILAIQFLVTGFLPCSTHHFALEVWQSLSATHKLQAFLHQNSCSDFLSETTSVQVAQPYIGNDETICTGDTLVFVAFPDISISNDSIPGDWVVRLQTGSTANPSMASGDSILTVVFTNTTDSILVDTVIFSNAGTSDTALVTVYPNAFYTYSDFICEGQTSFFNGQFLSVSGTYYDTLSTYLGCDSIIELELTVFPTSTETFNYTGCAGDGFYIVVNGVVYDQNHPVGTEYLPNQYGCDSIVEVNMAFESLTVSGVVYDVTYPGGDDGHIDLTVSGPSEPFTYDWSNDGPENPDNDPKDITGLVVGQYTVTVTNATGCTATAVFHVEQPTCNILLSATATDALCYAGASGTIDLTVSGSGAPFTYDWSNDGADVPDNDPQDLTGLPAGTYTVTVTDKYDCIEFLSIQVGQPDPLEIIGNVGNVSSVGASDGFIDITAVGGTPNYTYDWSNDGPENPGNDPEDLFDLMADTYIVTVTDANSCTESQIFNVNNPLIFDLALRKTLAVGQSVAVLPGEDVTFTITVFNQGQLAATNVLVIDYLPTNMTFSSSQNPSWVNFGAGPTLFIPSLAAGASYSKNIILSVSPTAPNGAINNYAEISSADDADPDTTGPPTDIDSNPNAYQSDDPGGLPGSSADDVITGDGTGAPGSNDPLTDEDDHDGAAVVVSLPSLTLGNLVFKDFDNDGLYNNLDEGISGVEVDLYDAGLDHIRGTGDDVLMDNQVTNFAGEYNFITYSEGYYYVVLNGNGIPANYISSTGNGVFDMSGAGPFEPATGANDDIDNVDDGTQSGILIISEVIQLAFGTEPDGDDNFTVDFGLYEPQLPPTVSLGDLVFFDYENDGIFNNADDGIANVEVQLYDAGPDETKGTMDDQYLESQFTNGFGEYLFEGLEEGFYYVVLTGNGIPANYISSTGDGIYDMDGAGPFEPATGTNLNINNQDDGTQVGDTISSEVIELLLGDEPDGDINLTVDFGFYEPQIPTLSLGNLIFHDYENDGIFNNTDGGIEDVEVELYSAGADHLANTGDDQYIATQYTNGFGEYLFMGLGEGFYFVKLTGVGIPANHVSSTGDGIYDMDGAGAYEPATGTDLNVDNTDDGTQMGAMIVSGVIELTAFEEPDVNENRTLDFGLYEPQIQPTLSLGNLVFSDLDNDGVFNNSDIGLEDVEVSIYEAGADHLANTSDDLFIETQTTNGFGQYLFTGLLEGFYFIKLTGVGIPTNYVSSTGDGIYDMDGAGAYEPATGVDDNVDNEDDGTQMNTIISSDVFELSLGDELDGDVNLTVDFGLYEPQIEPTVSLGNLVFHDKENDGIFNNNDEGIGGVTVQLFDAGFDQTRATADDIFKDSLFTNSAGEYLFSNLPEGYYFVKLNGNGLPANYVSSTGDGVLDNDGSGAFEPAVGTDGNMDNVDDGTQIGSAILSDVIKLTLGNEPDGDVNNTVDFGLYEPQMPASVGNFVWYDNNHNGQQDFNETGVENVNVKLFSTGPDGVKGGTDDFLAASQTTNSSGVFYVQNLLPGTYYLVFNPLSFPPNFSPTLQNSGDVATDSDADAMGITDVFTLASGEVNVSLDFGLFPAPASIGDFVWQDLNNNGMQDGGEPGIENIAVVLLDLGNDGMIGNDDNQIASTVTNASGQYSFSNVIPGSYYLVFDPTSFPQGFAPVTQNVSGSDNNDSDANAMGITEAFQIHAGDVNNTRDLGLYSSDFDLALTKTLSPGQSTSVDVGDEISYTITVTNQGANPVYNVKITDHYPAGLILSAGNMGWSTVAQNTVEYTIAGPIQPGDAVAVQILLTVQYAASGATLQNMAEVTNAEDINGDVITDLDSTPNNNNPGEDDMGDVSIELIPHDPTGWIFCEKTGKIITGGTISVTGPNGIPNSQVFIVNDGSNGYYEFYTDGTPGVYTLSYTHPMGYPLSVTCPEMAGPFDPTGQPDPIVFGVDTVNAMYLSDPTCVSNPHYLSFDIEPGDPNIHLNNLPVSCGYISAIVCEDTNFNDLIDAGDALQIGETVYLYDCADLTTPIDSTVTDVNGRYSFDALLPGDYIVGVGLLPNYRFVSTGNINQTGFSDCMTLAWGDCDTTKTFCRYACPSIDAGPDIDHCSSANASQLDANLAHGTGNFTWTPATGLSDPNIENPVASPASSTTYNIAFNDGFGCVAFDTISINVGSSTPYLANMPATDLTAQCAPLPVDDPVFADDCDASLTISTDTTTTLTPCGFVQTIDWTATNDEGNTATFSQTLTVEDTLPPTMTANHAFFGAILDGDSLTADCSMIPSLDSIGFAAFDNCSATTVNFTENIIYGDCPTDGFYQFRHCGWTATDACGNTDSLFFFVTIYDNAPPVLAPAPADITVSCGAVPMPAILGATDNCDDFPTVTVTEFTTYDSSGCLSQILRVWTAEDDCGNTSTDSQTITITDTIAPSLVGVPADLSLDCSSPVPAPATVTASDACDADITVIFNQSYIGNPSTACYSIVRTWMATDDCGNTGSASQTIIIFDDMPPILSGVPADTTYDCSTPVPFAATVTATDNCDPDVPVVFSEVITGNSSTGCFSIVRTWSATDDCGNNTSASQTIIVNDNTPPLLSGVPADLTIDCGTPVPTPANVTASDLCDANVPVVYNQNINGNPATACYVMTRTWTATDDCGNSVSASQTITVEDHTAPTLSAYPADVTVTCVSQIPPAPSITASDDCDTDVPVLFVQSSTGNPAGCNYQLMRTWGAADDCGNSVSWTQTITVNDDEPPVLVSVPADVVINCSDPVPTPASVTATDNCDPSVSVSMSTNYVGDSTSGCYIINRTWTATDDCGNSVSASQKITVRDLIAPDLIGVPNNGSANCDNLPGDNVTAIDNCDANVVVVITDQVQSSVNGCPTQILRRWTATDDCGNTRIASRTFNVSNTDVPVITILEPSLASVQDGDTLYLECDDLPGLSAASAIGSEDCCGAPTITFHETAVAGNCQTNGYMAMMHCGWTATDCCGNTGSLFFTVFLIDLTPPEFFGVPANVILPVGSPMPPVPTVFAVDNCDSNVPVSYNSVTTGPPDNQLTTRTWSASDDCGNIVTATQTILITNDMTAPILAGVPPDITIEGPVADLPNNSLVTASDNLDDNPEITFEENRTGGTCCYVVTRTWTATDDFGNSSSATQTITVTDSQAPVISGTVADVTGTCSLGDVPIPQLSATDNCTDILTTSFSADTTFLNCGFHVLRTWTFTDECGNTAIAKQNIHLEDTEAPAINPGSGIDLALFASQNASPNGGVSLHIGDKISANETWSIGSQTMPTLIGSATDNCTAADQIGYRVSNIVELNSGCTHVFTVTFKAVDACGNESSTFFTATASFEDDLAPSFATLPQDLMVNCGNVPTALTLTATDNIGTPTVAFDETTMPGCPVIITRTWTATDGCGNSTVAEQKIAIHDMEAPEILNVPGNVAVSCSNIPPVAINVVATDDCAASLPVTFSETTSGIGCQYTITRTWTAVDACGNSAIKQQHIFVADHTAPIIANAPSPELTVSCEAGLPAALALTVSDNCDAAPTINFEETTMPGGSACNYSVLRKWTVTDACGNSTVAAQTIHMTDFTSPTLDNVPADITATCGNFPASPTVTGTDNCDPDVEVIFKETTAPGCPQKIIRTWLGVDDCGNQTEATQIITILDNEPPVLSAAPADLNLACGADVPVAAVLPASDNCSQVTNVTMQEVVTGQGCSRTIVRTWTAVDQCGNAASVSQTIQVNDVEPPLLSAAPANLTLHCGDQIPVAVMLTASDNCSSHLQVSFLETTTNTACGQDILRTWTSTDDCGNTSTASQLISIVDDQAPTVLEPADLTVGCGGLPPVVTPVFSDNCDQSLNIQFTEITTQIACGKNVLRTWTATDDCGNSTVVDQLIHVIDQTPPVMNFANPLLTGLQSGDTLVMDCSNGLIFNQSDVTATDDCSNVTVNLDMVNFAYGNCATDGYLVRAKFNWEATDACGNSTNLTLNVRVEDNEPPIFPNLPDIVVNCGETAPDFIAPVVQDDCGDVAISFASQTVTTAYGQDIVGTWTAVDNCGNSANATQTMQIYSVGAAQLMGVPADLTVDLGNGEAIPAVANVTAVDNCSGASLPLVFEENSHQAGPCNTVIERSWSVVGMNGLTVSETQIITVLDQAQFTASMAADSCNSSNGSVILNPSTLDFAWSIGGSGAVQTNLAAGTYAVTATNANGCSSTIEVVVDAVCNCELANVKEVRRNITACGENKGKAVIHITQNTADYQYNWSPDLGTPNNLGNARANLPAGHYEVQITLNSLASCMTSTSFDIEDDCADCGAIFGDLPTSISAPSGPVDVCLPVPFGLTSNYEIRVDGQVFTGMLEPCAPHLVKVYSYANVPTVGGYSVIWEHDGTTFYTLLDQLSELVPAMNFVDPNGHWFDDATAKEISTTNLGGDYGQLSIRQNGTGLVKNLSATTTTTNTGTLLTLPSGGHEISYLNSSTGCTDELFVNISGEEGESTFVLPDQNVDARAESDVNGEAAAAGILVYNGFSPNGDGKNDYFKIEGLDKYPHHMLRIYNGYGRMVFKTGHYLSDWGGSWGQNNLPNGTYYYLLEDGKGKTYTGYVQVKR
ncbi:MAG: DUF11 domain-containing protein [Bacteroidetes bacterium]|nr:DUF11 domain-containing protein [Bacteroidota bacterium]